MLTSVLHLEGVSCTSVGWGLSGLYQFALQVQLWQLVESRLGLSLLPRSNKISSNNFLGPQHDCRLYKSVLHVTGNLAGWLLI